MKTAPDYALPPSEEKRAFRKKFFAGNRVCFFKAFWKTEPYKKAEVAQALKKSDSCLG